VVLNTSEIIIICILFICVPTAFKTLNNGLLRGANNCTLVIQSHVQNYIC